MSKKEYTILLRKDNAHDDSINTCSWAKVSLTGNQNGPFKEYIVTGSLDSKIKIWQLVNNQLELVHDIVGGNSSILSLAVSPDGHTIASTTLLESKISVWELVSGEKVYDIDAGDTDVWKIVFSPDGTQLATGGHSGKIHVYDVMTGTLAGFVETREKFSLSIDWSANGRFIAIGSAEQSVSIFDVTEARLLHTIDARNVRSVAFSKNSKLIAAACEEGAVKIYDAVNPRLVASLQHEQPLNRVQFSPDGSRLAAADCQGRVLLADAQTLGSLHNCQDHSDIVWDLQFNFDGTKLLTVSKDKSIIIYLCVLLQRKK